MTGTEREVYSRELYSLKIYSLEVCSLKIYSLEVCSLKIYSPGSLFPQDLFPGRMFLLNLFHILLRWVCFLVIDLLMICYGRNWSTISNLIDCSTK